jgi:hypothetical protein
MQNCSREGVSRSPGRLIRNGRPRLEVVYAESVCNPSRRIRDLWLPIQSSLRRSPTERSKSYGARYLSKRYAPWFNLDRPCRSDSVVSIVPNDPLSSRQHGAPPMHRRHRRCQSSLLLRYSSITRFYAPVRRKQIGWELP